MERKVDICVKLFQRSEDEDEGIRVSDSSVSLALPDLGSDLNLCLAQDLAVRTIEELWFSDPTGEETRVDASGLARTRTAVVMGVAGCFRERQNPLEIFLRQVSCL